jgi:hypothetical protein
MVVHDSKKLRKSELCNSMIQFLIFWAGEGKSLEFAKAAKFWRKKFGTTIKIKDVTLSFSEYASEARKI